MVRTFKAEEHVDGTISLSRSKGLSQKISVLGVLAAVWVFAAIAVCAEEQSAGESLYQEYCASCHGAHLRGGNAQSLVDSVWQFGDSRGYIFRNIKYGVPHLGMPSYEDSLSDRQINRIIDFLLEAEKRAGTKKPGPPEELETLDYKIKVDVWAEGLSIPWSIDFLDAKTALVTERPGRLRIVNDGGLVKEPIKGTPEVVAEGQGGLLDVTVDPNYKRNGWVYLAYSHALEGVEGNRRPPAMTRIVRGRVKDGLWKDEQTVYEAPGETYLETRHHYGCRIVFDPEGYLYFCIGERGRASHAQDLDKPNGKIHRVRRDGSVPEDNPFAELDDRLATIFTYGNRNPQGMAVHPITGEVWETEHGPMGGDELNLLKAGRNYGWPVITYGRNYDGSIITTATERQGMEQPVVYWKPSPAVCGVDFYRGEMFARWRNRLLVGALKYEEVRLLDIKDNRVLHQEVILKNAGRVRDVACGPDGAIYVVLNQPGTILRLTPLEMSRRSDSSG